MRHVLIGLIRIYQRYISRWTPAVCRFPPTCSEYAAQALAKHGALKAGGWRCGAFAAAIRSIRAATTRFTRSFAFLSVLEFE